MNIPGVGLCVTVGKHTISFLDVGQDAWAQTLRAGETHLMETTSILVWSALSEQSGVAVDVGGFNGLYAMIAAKSGASRVFCFEPVALSYGCLVMNLRLNGLDGRVVAVNCALGDDAGRVLISSQSGPYVMASGESLIEADWPHHIPVEVQRFDSIWNGKVDALAWPVSTFQGAVGIMKLDVEGFELSVLAGMESELFGGGRRPHILVELLTPEAADRFVRALPSEYRCLRVHEGDPRLQRLTRDEVAAQSGGNFLFSVISDESLEGLERRVEADMDAGMWSAQPLDLVG